MMTRGAVAMLDVLGFKGIWGRHDPAEVIRAMKTAQSALQSVEANAARLSTSLKSLAIEEVKTACISDTIVIGVRGRAEPGLDPQKAQWLSDARALKAAALIAATSMRFALQPTVRFAYRGCISLGDFAIDGSFVIGPAVDDAATHCEQAEGAFVWLTPSAKRFADDMILADDALETTSPALVWQPWDVPLKGGRSYFSHAVIPFVGLESVAREDLAKRLLATFGSAPSLNVDIKRSNTADFLATVLDGYKEIDARNANR